MISPNFKVREFEVKDINNWPITIEYPSDKGGQTEQLVIQRGTASPCTAKVTFHKDKSFAFKLRFVACIYSYLYICILVCVCQNKKKKTHTKWNEIIELNCEQTTNKREFER